MQRESQKDRKSGGANRSLKIAFFLAGAVLIAVILTGLALKLLFGVRFDREAHECKHIYRPRISSNRLLWA